MTDHEIIQNLASQNPNTVDLLYRRFAEQIRRYLQTIIHDRCEVEDLVQDVFVQIWRHASTYQDSLGSPKTWIFRIAHNRAIDYLRSRRYQQIRREVDVDGEFDVVDELYIVNGWDEPIDSQRTVVVHQALTQLPYEHRSLIELAFYQGYTHREISHLKGLPLGTVKTRIRNGIQSLRNHLGFLAEEIQVA